MSSAPKRILVLSPQPFEWQVSKRHYAEAWATLGYEVYFMQPPTAGLNFSVEVEPTDVSPNISLVNLRLPLPNFVRLRLKQGPQSVIYTILMGRIAKALAKQLPAFDHVVSFDNTLYFPCIEAFGGGSTSFMIMDALPEYSIKQVKRLATNVDVIGAVAGFFLEPFRVAGARVELLHHGLGQAFEKLAQDSTSVPQKTTDSDHRIHVGYVGNLTRTATDFENIKQVIRNHPDFVFEFWGPDGYDIQSKSALPTAAQEYLRFLDAQSNVVRHGMVPPSEIALASSRIDIWMACYDYRDDVNADEHGVSNSHKLMEYLATGKVIASNLFSMYLEVEHLLAMMPSPSNHGFPEHFSAVADDLSQWNNPDRRQERIRFALSNTYLKQAERLLNFMKDESDG